MQNLRLKYQILNWHLKLTEFKHSRAWLSIKSNGIIGSTHHQILKSQNQNGEGPTRVSVCPEILMLVQAQIRSHSSQILFPLTCVS